MKIVIEFETDNASFKDDPNTEADNICKVLRDHLSLLLHSNDDNREFMIDMEMARVIKDVNGNKIGTIKQVE